MKKKYFYCLLSVLLLLVGSYAFAQGEQATNSVGKVGFIEKNPPEKPPEFRENQTKSQLTLGNESLPKVSDDELGTGGMVIVGFIIVIATLTRGRLTSQKEKENSYEKNDN